MNIKIPQPFPVAAQNLMMACDELESHLSKNPNIGLLGLRERLTVSTLSEELEKLLPIALANQRVLQSATDVLHFMRQNIGPNDDYPMKLACDNPETSNQMAFLLQTADRRNKELAEICAKYSGCTVDELNRLLENKNKK